MSEIKTNMSIKDNIGTKHKRKGKNMGIYNNLNGLIEDGRKTQAELADAIGVSTKQIQRWKAGTSEMGIDKLKKICILYGVSADYILGLPKGLSWPR